MAARDINFLDARDRTLFPILKNPKVIFCQTVQCIAGFFSHDGRYFNNLGLRAEDQFSILPAWLLDVLTGRKIG